jgi:hypothetical protein
MLALAAGLLAALLVTSSVGMDISGRRLGPPVSSHPRPPMSIILTNQPQMEDLITQPISTTATITKQNPMSIKSARAN